MSGRFAALAGLALLAVFAAGAAGARTPRIDVDFSVRAVDRTTILAGSGHVVIVLRGSKLVTTTVAGLVTVDGRRLFHSFHIELRPLASKTLLTEKVGGTVQLAVTRSNDAGCPVGGTALLLMSIEKKTPLSSVILHPFKACSRLNNLWTNTIDGATVRIVVHSRIS